MHMSSKPKTGWGGYLENRIAKFKCKFWNKHI